MHTILHKIWYYPGKTSKGHRNTSLSRKLVTYGPKKVYNIGGRRWQKLFAWQKNEREGEEVWGKGRDINQYTDVQTAK